MFMCGAESYIQGGLIYKVYEKYGQKTLNERFDLNLYTILNRLLNLKNPPFRIKNGG